MNPEAAIANARIAAYTYERLARQMHEPDPDVDVDPDYLTDAINTCLDTITAFATLAIAEALTGARPATEEEEGEFPDV